MNNLLPCSIGGFARLTNLNPDGMYNEVDISFVSKKMNWNCLVNDN